MPIRYAVPPSRALPLLAVALAGAACRESPAAPRSPSGPPPSGLSTSLAIIRTYQAPPPDRPSITADGDSVVATAKLGVSGCRDYGARAGVVDGVLVVTVVDSAPPVSRLCTLEAGFATFRAVVRAAPRGRYDAVLRARVESTSGAPSESELVRQSVTLY